MNAQRDRKGGTLLFIVFFMLAAISMAALVVDVGVWYSRKAQAQMHADMAAVTSLGSIDPDRSYEDQRQQVLDTARAVLRANGYDPARWAISAEPNTEPPAGRYVAQTTVIGVEPLPTFLLALFSGTRPSMAVRAVAAGKKRPMELPPCAYLALKDIKINGDRGMVVDSYSSRTGDYAPVTTINGIAYQNSKATACANHKLEVEGAALQMGGAYSAHDIDVRAGATVAGDAWAAHHVKGSGTILGERREQADIPRFVLPPVDEPDGVRKVNDNATGVTIVTQTGPTVFRGGDKLDEKSSWQSVRFKAGGTYYFREFDLHRVPAIIDGDPAVAGPTRIYVSKKLHAYQGIQFQQALSAPGASLGGVKASDLQILGIEKEDDGDDDDDDDLNDDDASITIKAGSKNVADIHAPRKRLKLEASAHLFGRIRVEKIEFKDTSRFTYDEAFDPPPASTVPLFQAFLTR